MLAYCGFLARPGLSLPVEGVAGAAIDALADEELRLLWSEIEYPLQPSQFRRDAVAFHRVLHRVFAQTAVIPFRFPSLFANRSALAGFIAGERREFAADLRRLKDHVQMECVVLRRRDGADVGSGTAYLTGKRAADQAITAFAQQVKQAVSPLAAALGERPATPGTRICALWPRGREADFAALVRSLPVSRALETRVSGPWPASAFLSGALAVAPRQAAAAPVFP